MDLDTGLKAQKTSVAQKDTELGIMRLKVENLQKQIRKQDQDSDCEFVSETRTDAAGPAVDADAESGGANDGAGPA